MIGSAVLKAALSRFPLPVWAAGAAVLVMAIPLGVQTVRLSASQAEAARLTDRVERLSADLATCRGNTATLEASIADQNAAVDAMAANASAAIARAEEAAQEARRNAAEAQARADRFLARPIRGETLAARVLDVDQAIVAELGGVSVGASGQPSPSDE